MYLPDTKPFNISSPLCPQNNCLSYHQVKTHAVWRKTPGRALHTTRAGTSMLERECVRSLCTEDVTEMVTGSRTVPRVNSSVGAVESDQSTLINPLILTRMNLMSQKLQPLLVEVS